MIPTATTTATFPHTAVGFTGSRHLDAGPAQSRAAILALAAETAGATVLVGDASGLDAVVRQVARRPRVFHVIQSGPRGLVDRSTRLVQSLHFAPSPILIGFPARPCPPDLRPSAVPSRCFAGFGSGTWATLALAVGLSVPVRVWLPDTDLPPRTWGPWRLETDGPFSDLWALNLTPRPTQLNLF